MRTSHLLASILLSTACGGGKIATGQILDGGSPPAGPSFVAWPVTDGTVTAYAVDANLQRGTVAGTAQTDATGSFKLKLSMTTTTQLLLVASSGSYTEPATGTPISVGGYELTALLPSATRLPGDEISGALVSPVSHLSALLAARFVSQGMAPDVALTKAKTLLNAHFGGIDWSTLAPPPDLSDATSSTIVQLNDTAKAGLILAGLSMEARSLAQAKHLTPGGPLNSLSLLSAIAADLTADGYFDGQGAGGTRLTVPPSATNAYALDGQTVRATLAQGISNFLSSSRNSSHIAQADAQALMTAIATDSNTQLFRDQGGTLDITPPTIAFVQPAANASVHGQVTIEAIATDDNVMGTLTFSAPDVLTATQATLENSGKTMRIKTILDVSALPDGSLTISVAASDAASNTSTQSLIIRVANHGPVINVSAPTSGQTVKGTATISATASGQNGATVTALILVNPPPGAGADVLPAADALSISWDSTQTLEGPTTLHFQASDSFGGLTDLFVPVIVDNVPFGVLDVTVSAGAPIAGATVSVVAIDDVTGSDATSIGPNNGVLGQCSATNASGFLSCVLSVENYQGPIQVRAFGTGLSYLDPSDGITTISVSTQFQFSSFIGHYKTGQHIAVPLTLWTTLDDQVVLAYLAGADRAASAPHSLATSLATIDPLFSKHLTLSTSWDVRGTIPVSLTTSAQSLRDVVYAAMPDIALNQIARDKSAVANVTPGGVITAVTVLQLLERDAIADGQFDGLSGNAQLKTAGNPQQLLDPSWLRYAMAQALDEWFKGGTNKTALTSSDVQSAGVFDTVAGDTSILFPSSVVPPPYDNTPPSVTITSTFTSNGSTSSPVSYAAQLLVAGSLHLLVTASDPSGVQATSVQYQGSGGTSWTQVTPAGGSTATNFSGDIDTTSVADGIITVQVLSTDKVGNPGTTTRQYVVKNTAPAIALVQPVAPSGYPNPALPAYSSIVPANITVTDAQGTGAVATVSETSLNVTLTNSTSAGASTWLGAWAIPSAQADATLSFTYKACDIVFNCRTRTIPFAVDRTPPLVSITTAPPRYTNPPSVNIVAAASDGAGSGVAGVFAQNVSASSAPVAGVYDAGSGSWTISGIGLKPNSDNTIVVYGVDNALDSSSTIAGANGGAGRNPPYQQTAYSMNDQSSPNPTASVSQPASYYDERAMRLVQLSGRPANLTSSWYFDPSSFANSTAAPFLGVDISGATPVHKTLQRIALGTNSPTLSDLLGARGSSTNTPYIAITVPYNAGSEAPIVSASYSATVTCSGCPSFAPANGALVKDTVTVSDGTRYLLPLSTEIIPALGQINSQATVYVSANATDAAGNTRVSPLQVATITFALDAPPIVAMVQNTNYATSGDPWAVSACKIANGTYTNCFAAATPSTPAEGNRLLEYVVYNFGASYGLSFQLSTDPADSTHSSPVVEGWEGWDDVPLSAPSPYGGFWCTRCGGGGSCSTGYVYYTWLTGGVAGCPTTTTINNPAMTYAPTKQTTAPVAMHVYRANADGVSIAGDAAVAPNNSYVIPAAVGGYMGMALILVGRTSASITRGNLDVAPGPAKLTWNSNTGRYESPFAWVPQPPITYDKVDCAPSPESTCYNDRSDWYKQLDYAQSNIYGALSNVVANGFASGTTNALGASTSPTTITLTSIIGQ